MNLEHLTYEDIRYLFSITNPMNVVQFDQKFGYSVYRTVLGYYTGADPEDGYDMRKALPRDVDKKSIIPLKHPITPDQLEW